MKTPGAQARLHLPDEAAMTRQTERDNLNELIQAAEADHGPVTDEEIQGLRVQLHEARRQQTGRGMHTP